jgi:hypothetical protein
LLRISTCHVSGERCCTQSLICRGGAMSQQNASLPPPPPTPRTAQHAAGDFYTQRRARPAPTQPPSLTTEFLRVQGGTPGTPTPISSGGNGTPFPFSPTTPVALNPRLPSALNPPSVQAPSRSPIAGMEPYDPRTWSQARQMSGSQILMGRTSTVEATGMERTSSSSLANAYTKSTMGYWTPC